MGSGKNGVEYKAYCGTFDNVCTPPGLVLPFRPNEIEVNTGFGRAGIRYINTHDRNRYQTVIGLPQF